MKRFNDVELCFIRRTKLLSSLQEPTRDGNSSITIFPSILRLKLHRRMPKNSNSFVNYLKRIQGSIYYRALSSHPKDKAVNKRFVQTGTFSTGTLVTDKFENALLSMNGTRKPRYDQAIEVCIILDKKAVKSDDTGFYKHKVSGRPVVLAVVTILAHRDKNKAMQVMRKKHGTHGRK